MSVIEAQSAARKSDDARDAHKFGTIKGVYIPSVLTIFGVIMYLRFGWVLGHRGLMETLIIVVLACSVTLLTALSIAATATNMNVKGGGAYYMISRSLGLEAGAAIGVPLYLAQAFGVSFYLAGFGESIANLLPVAPAPVVATLGLGVLLGLAFKSADVALKSQYLVLALMVASLVAFFMGGTPDEAVLAELAAQGRTAEPYVSFWAAFAVFFPAVTGIEAGISMSGDLKNPSKSLPLGTILAVLTGLMIYLAIPIFFAWHVKDPAALKSSRIMQKVAAYEPLIIVGIWGATLSSAMGALLGAPRTLQALARDGVFSRALRVIGKGYGKEDSPRIATVITGIVALIGVLLGDLNAIAPVLSMFFLTSYGALNFSAGIEGMIANPAWRPTFRTPWVLSLLAAFLCFAIMFMIDPGVTFIALAITFTIFYFASRRGLKANFGDLRRGILMFLARYSIFRLAELPPNVRSWRPNVLCLSGSPTSRWYLIEIADAITHGKGFLTVATIIPKGSTAEDRIPALRKTIDDYLKRRAVPALVSVSASDDISDGILSLVRNYGLGPIMPNTILLGETEKEANFEAFAELIIRIYQAQRNIVIVRQGDTDGEEPERRIDVWWGRERENAGLCLALGYMMQNSPVHAGTELHLKTVVTDPGDQGQAQDFLGAFIKEGRFEAKAAVFVTEPQRAAVFAKIREESQGAKLVFMGMEPPKLERFVENRDGYIKEYARYYEALLDQTRGFPTIAFVLSSEPIKFSEIFSG